MTTLSAKMDGNLDECTLYILEEESNASAEYIYGYYRWACNITRHYWNTDLENLRDVVSDALTKVLEHSIDLQGWTMCRVLRNVASNARRLKCNSAPRVDVMDNEKAISDANETLTEAQAEALEMLDAVMACIEGFEQKDRILFNLAFRDKLRAGEIGRALGVSPASARKRVQRLREKICMHVSMFSEEENE